MPPMSESTKRELKRRREKRVARSYAALRKHDGRSARPVMYRAIALAYIRDPERVARIEKIRRTAGVDIRSH